ncbi:IPExxxVDY family protein [Flagellimonas hymeniacidonis]|uniref:IPExxxVDY family protein n=1 Tax=Flagellimonas hymeniacidonis TaxID=2603628 RepID=A0A5C8V7H4_9FLAO|nr:IPExxxVDY family protein [Flagellimonas hymeniacidonis]TXN37865.1 IPExxxVDY family protein [Flagellimonas hymeniacidonis]
MLTTHKISADFYDDNFQLIAIHSGLEDYAMGYAINSNCGLHLTRMKSDLQFDKNLSFSVFEWDDEMNDTYWTLISNKCTLEVEVPSYGFFENNTALQTAYLIEEKKEVDYFLKVDADNDLKLTAYMKPIQMISKVITAYPVETQSLKSKRNLIF